MTIFKNCRVAFIAATAMTLASCTSVSPVWIIDSQEDWQEQSASQKNINFEDGFADPTAKESSFKSIIKRFDKKQSAKSIVFDQSPIWQNWQPVANIGPDNLRDAPVFLSLGPKNYWMFGIHGGLKNSEGFSPQPTEVEGFDMPLLTTPDPTQFTAPGGLKKSKGGYHAWQSRDMVNWVHHGPVTERFSRWVTTAEHVDGKTYIYYDYPNDMDPHVYIDADLTDGLPGENKGLAFADPSLGSDCTFIRDEKGNFHIIYEDWSPIHAGRHSWDSPLAGHAVSKSGLGNFKILDPVVDNRTTATGELATYKLHRSQQPKSYKGSLLPARLSAKNYEIATYQVHSPEQEAYGDWAAINIGGQYYIFGDYDPVGGHKMSTCWFTSSSLNGPFTWCDNVGEGHPDPDIGFAEGKFYLMTQPMTDFVSPGPWVEKVEVRVGVDTDNDGKIDQWTFWQEVKESYDYKKGFSKHVEKTAAAIDLSSLPEGYGFQFEFKMTDTTENKSKPIMDKVSLYFGK